MLKPFIITNTIAFLLMSCATSPLGRSQLMLMPDSQLDEMGIQAFDNLKQETAIETNSRLNNYISCIAKSIIQVSGSPITNWEVAVFRDKAANAFALPGGKVGVYTGMLEVAKNQNQLATVIGHEIAHVTSHHGNERVSQEFAIQQGMGLIQAIGNPQTQMGQTLMGLLGVGLQVGVLLPYSRVQESEADLVGLTLIAQAGFDPKESVALWQNMSNVRNQGETVDFLSTHPSNATRIKDLSNAMASALTVQRQAQATGKRPQCNY